MARGLIEARGNLTDPENHFQFTRFTASVLRRLAMEVAGVVSVHSVTLFSVAHDSHSGEAESSSSLK